MNPWGFVLVAVGILLIMIGFTGSQHKILEVLKGVPAAAKGTAPTPPPPAADTQKAANPPGGVTLV